MKAKKMFSAMMAGAMALSLVACPTSRHRLISPAT